MKKKIILMFLTALLITNKGVAMGKRPDYKTEIQEKYRQLNLSDGVSKEEAIIIAQNYLIDEDLDSLLIVTNPKVESYDIKEGYWLVSFPATFKVRWTQGLKWGSALVDKITGKVIYRGEGPS